MYNNGVMLDLETLGTSPNAAIVSIGAVYFDIKNQGILDEFYVVVDAQSSIKSGGTVNFSTIKWWIDQSKEAKEVFQEEDTIEISKALSNFSTWLKNIKKDINIWSNGADFDIPILSSAYIAQNISIPWSFRDIRCFRTLASIYPDIKYVKPLISHNSLEDAKAQAIHLMKIFKKYKIKKE